MSERKTEAPLPKKDQNRVVVVLDARLSRKEAARVVGAKNCMGTCSG